MTMLYKTVEMEKTITTPIGTRHLVDPELLRMLDAWPTVELSDETLIAMRAANRLPIAEDTATQALVDSRVLTVPGPPGAPDIKLFCYRPRECDPVFPATVATLPCILHIHGGGFVGGSAEPLAPIHRALVAELGCALVSVEYRLAPETIYPGAVKDCYAALSWMVANAADLGIDPARIGVMGESAGGGLAAALALLVRDRGEYALAFQHLIYPMLDDRTCMTANPNPTTGEFVWTPHNNAFGWAALLGHAPGGPHVIGYAAPARAGNLADLPPTFIATGSLDLFFDEDIQYTRRLAHAGVSIELHVYPGAFHGFDLDPAAQVSIRARRDSHAALKRALGPIR
jgi:acetyl esterase/lipase